MAMSLRSILYEIQPIVGSFIDPQLQSIGIQLISALDEIDRNLYEINKNTLKNKKYLFQISESELNHLDYLKLEILSLLRQIKRITGSSLQFGLSLYSYHFSSVDEGTETPDFSQKEQIMARNVGERIMQEELTKINQTPTRKLSGISPLGDACMLALDIAANANHRVSWQELADLIKERVRNGQSDGAMGSELLWTHPPEIVRGRIIRLAMCLPLQGEELFVIEYKSGYWAGDDYWDKFPQKFQIDYFKVFYKKFKKSPAKSREVSAIKRRAVNDGIGLEEFLRAHGWRDLREE